MRINRSAINCSLSSTANGLAIFFNMLAQRTLTSDSQLTTASSVSFQMFLLSLIICEASRGKAIWRSWFVPTGTPPSTVAFMLRIIIFCLGLQIFEPLLDYYVLIF